MIYYIKNHWKIVLVIFIALAIILVAGIILSSKKNSDKENLNNNIQLQETNEQSGKDWLYNNKGCKGSGSVEFGTSPMKFDQFGSIIPYGLMIDSHVTPIDHQYFSPKDYNSKKDAYEARAIADGTILEIGTWDSGVNSVDNEYRIVFEHTYTFLSYFDLLTSLDDVIMQEVKPQLDKKGHFYGRIPVKEGQLIGRIGGQTLDFGVYNQKVKLGFINPESYQSELWKIHTDETFKYFKEPIRSKLIERNLRKVEPINGKINYDIAGKIVGTWFLKGTKGYEGTNREKYWSGHLSIVYDHIDPNLIIISIGDFGGESTQDAVKGNTPDPANISIEDGMIKYELVNFDYYIKNTEKNWDRESWDKEIIGKESTQSKGMILVQLLDDEKLKVETFPDKSANQVPNFTENAKIYER